MLIDATAQQDDVAATLSHYDHALSAYPEIRQQLFPILASDLTEPDVRLALAAFAAKPWLRDFVTNASDFDVAPISLMAFYSELAGKVPIADLQAGTIRTINWLADNRQSAALGALANRIPGVAPGAFDQLGFNTMTTDARFKPLSWDIHNDGEIATEANGNSLAIQIEPENNAVAATRLTFLKPGVYDVRQTVSYATNTMPARLEWLVSCVGEVQTVIISETLPVASASTRHMMHLVVPAGCGAQAWQLKAAAGQSQFASTARIDGLAMKQP